MNGFSAILVKFCGSGIIVPVFKHIKGRKERRNEG
jgi:hypothetical protein